MLEVTRMTTTTELPISVVLVEDDERLAKLTARYLESHGVTVTIVGDGRDAVGHVVKARPDVVLLDLMLPGMSGLDVCRELRSRTDVPILMVTARGEEADRVVGLEGGADDYIVRAHARRARGNAGPAKKTIRIGRIAIDVDAMQVTLDDAPLALTTYEFMLLRALAERAGRVLTREQLVDIVRGSAEEAFDRSVDVHVSHLRGKLGDDPRNPRIIKTVRGVGYMLALERG